MENENRYIPGPKKPIFVQGFTLAAGETKIVDIVETVAIFFVHGLKFGTSAGDISLSLGTTGDFFDISPGDVIKFSPVGQIRVKNNFAGASRSFTLIFANDPNFDFRSYSRGL